MSGAPKRIVIKIMLQIIAVVYCYLLDAENRKYCSTAIGQEEEKMQDAVFQRIDRSVGRATDENEAPSPPRE